ncbi:MAG: hypothetical protein ACI4KC_04565 [Gemmiger sp.]
MPLIFWFGADVSFCGVQGRAGFRRGPVLFAAEKEFPVFSGQFEKFHFFGADFA